MTAKRVQILAVVLAAGCAGGPEVPGVRFANAPAVRVVDDRRDVATRPAEREFLHTLYHYDGVVQRRLSRALELPRPRRARGVNALDEVPDSTWFTNRIGARDLTLSELRNGPIVTGSPEPHKPWRVHSTKYGGTEPGLMVSDARGKRYLLKLDPAEFAEQSTAAHVIVGRMLWAFGYNVTEDHVVYFRPDELVIGPDAVAKDALGGEHPLGRDELVQLLHRGAVEADGRIRALASQWLDGKPLGGHPAEGVRRDDPNDRIPHELRRDLRGAYAIYAWLDHVDVQEGNFLDLWIEDGGRHYVKHYLLDFGKGLGVMGSTGRSPRHGHEYVIDLGAMLRSLATLGFFERPWEGRSAPRLRGVGLFAAGDFRPGAWRPDFPSYVPLLAADRIDKFWGAKILIRFTREQIRTIVETGRLSDPRAVEYLTETLVARQRATARYWFERVNPLDRFAVTASATSAELCFDDLTLAYGLDPYAWPTRYRVTTYDVDARVRGATATITAGVAGRTCTGALAIGAPFGGYTIVRIATSRGGAPQRGETFVHLAREPASGLPRVIGIWRS